MNGDAPFGRWRADPNPGDDSSLCCSDGSRRVHVVAGRQVVTSEGIEVLAIWSGLPHYINATPNPRGALALLRKVSQFLDTPFELSKLKDDAVRFEEEISKVVAADDELTEYVKELKRREFAQ